MIQITTEYTSETPTLDTIFTRILVGAVYRLNLLASLPEGELEIRREIARRGFIITQDEYGDAVVMNIPTAGKAVSITENDFHILDTATGYTKCGLDTRNWYTWMGSAISAIDFMQKRYIDRCGHCVAGTKWSWK